MADDDDVGGLSNNDYHVKQKLDKLTKLYDKFIEEFPNDANILVKDMRSTITKFQQDIEKGTASETSGAPPSQQVNGAESPQPSVKADTSKYDDAKAALDVAVNFKDELVEKKEKQEQEINENEKILSTSVSENNKLDSELIKVKAEHQEQLKRSLIVTADKQTVNADVLNQLNSVYEKNVSEISTKISTLDVEIKELGTKLKEAKATLLDLTKQIKNAQLDIEKKQQACNQVLASSSIIDEKFNKVVTENLNLPTNLQQPTNKVDGIIQIDNALKPSLNTAIKTILRQFDDFMGKNNQVFFNDIRKSIQYVRHCERDIKKRLKMQDPDEDHAVGLDRKLKIQYNNYIVLIKKFDTVLDGTKHLIEMNMNELLKKIDEIIEFFKTRIVQLDGEHDRLKYENKLLDFKKKVQDAKLKLMSMYRNDITLMDIIMDNHFIGLYVLKCIQYGLIVGSIFLTEKIFSNMYMQQVYANNGDPPNLMTMLGIFLAINFGFTLFLTVVMFLLQLIAKTHWEKRNFIIDMSFIKKFLIDYVCVTLVLTLLLSIICLYMQSKKYFRYKTEGLRAIRALSDMTISIAPIVVIVPFFAIF